MLYKMGYRLSFTEIYHSYIRASEEEKAMGVAVKGWSLLSGCVEFSRRYEETVFQNLPDGWYYYIDEESSDNYTRVCYYDLKPHEPATQKELNMEIKMAVRGMEKWASDLMNSKHYCVYRMAGLL